MNCYLEKYYSNNGKEMQKMVKRIISSFGGLSQKDEDDFYSIANETFVNVLEAYDGDKNFDSFLYSCVKRKIFTEITRRNRFKRKSNVKTIPIDDREDDTHRDKITEIVSDFNVWEEVTKKDIYSSKLKRYLKTLSKTQRNVLFLLAGNYKADEIEKILNISHKEFTDCVGVIKNYDNISILLH